jgi:hypothetical protein
MALKIISADERMKEKSGMVGRGKARHGRAGRDVVW